MKTTIKTVFFLVIFSTLSCSSGDKKESISDNTFFAKIDGVDYKPEFVTGFLSTGLNNILLTGNVGTDAETIQISVPSDIAVGTYTDINNALANTFIQMYYSPPNSNNADDDGFADTGSITITAHNTDSKTIEGTFSFVTRPAISSGISWVITEGSFKISYTNI